jgi:hypothetical protein
MLKKTRSFTLPAGTLCLFLLLAGAAGCAPGAFSLRVPAKAPAGLTELRRSELPDMPLRGYGSLGGEFVEYALTGGKETASVLHLRCATAEKAGITLGKYRSDLRALGGVTESTAKLRGNAIPVALIDGCGAILAARQNRTVLIVTAPGTAELDTLLNALKLDLAADLDFSGAPVPYFLDKFDRWGFGFWCNPPLRTPEKQEATYDVREKFDWAKKTYNPGPEKHNSPLVKQPFFEISHHRHKCPRWRAQRLGSNLLPSVELRGGADL